MGSRSRPKIWQWNYLRLSYLLDGLENLLPDDCGTVLDVGCGSSPYSEILDCSLYVGLDITKGDGVDVLGSVTSLPLKEKSVGLIICTEVLEHIPSPEDAVLEMRRVLREGGEVICTSPFAMPIHGEPDDFQRFTPFGLRNYFSDFSAIEFFQCERGLVSLVSVSNTLLRSFNPFRLGRLLPLWEIVKTPLYTLLNLSGVLFRVLGREEVESGRFPFGYVFIAKK